MPGNSLSLSKELLDFHEFNKFRSEIIIIIIIKETGRIQF
jgi:hypothetical protein